MRSGSGPTVPFSTTQQRMATGGSLRKTHNAVLYVRLRRWAVRKNFFKLASWSCWSWPQMVTLSRYGKVARNPFWSTIRSISRWKTETPLVTPKDPKEIEQPAISLKSCVLVVFRANGELVVRRLEVYGREHPILRNLVDHIRYMRKGVRVQLRVPVNGLTIVNDQPVLLTGLYDHHLSSPRAIARLNDTFLQEAEHLRPNEGPIPSTVPSALSRDGLTIWGEVRKK